MYPNSLKRLNFLKELFWKKNATPTLSAAHQIGHFEDCRHKFYDGVHWLCTGNRNTAYGTTDAVLTQLIRTEPRIYPPKQLPLSLAILNLQSAPTPHWPFANQINNLFIDTFEMAPSETNNTCQNPVKITYQALPTLLVSCILGLFLCHLIRQTRCFLRDSRLTFSICHVFTILFYVYAGEGFFFKSSFFYNQQIR